MSRDFWGDPYDGARHPDLPDPREHWPDIDDARPDPEEYLPGREPRILPAGSQPTPLKDLLAAARRDMPWRTADTRSSDGRP